MQHQTKNQSKMKRLVSVLMAMLPLCMLTLESSSKENVGAQISLRLRHPIGGATRPSKAPEIILVPVEVAYDEFNDVLYFYDENDDTVSFFIYNDEGNCISDGACVFDEYHSYSMSPGLGTDTYMIVVLINGVEYFGCIDIEER